MFGKLTKINKKWWGNGHKYAGEINQNNLKKNE
jgi:hypothetical protein